MYSRADENTLVYSSRVSMYDIHRHNSHTSCWCGACSGSFQLHYSIVSHTHILPWQQVCGRCRIVTVNFAGAHNCSINFFGGCATFFTQLTICWCIAIHQLGKIQQTQFSCSSTASTHAYIWLVPTANRHSYTHTQKNGLQCLHIRAHSY